MTWSASSFHISDSLNIDSLSFASGLVDLLEKVVLTIRSFHVAYISIIPVVYASNLTTYRTMIFTKTFSTCQDVLYSPRQIFRNPEG